MASRIIAVVFLSAVIFLITALALKNISKQTITPQGMDEEVALPIINKGELNPLTIEAISQKTYDGGQIKIENELPSGVNYKRYIASYTSEGNKIYGLLTVPTTEEPEGGYPAIIFNHGYIPPEQYATTERYVAYVDNLASAGYVVFKIDYRGHGESEGQPSGAYFSPGYTADALNAANAVSKLDYVNPEKIGAWGHSMAGMILTRAIVAKPDVFKAVNIWGGVVGSYEDLMREWWSKRRPGPTFSPSQRELNSNRPSRQLFIKEYGEPNEKNAFWQSISPKAYISDIKIPIELHHGEADETVPVSLSVQFADALKKADKQVEVFTYPGADHDISSPSYGTAMQRTIDFFDKYLKN